MLAFRVKESQEGLLPYPLEEQYSKDKDIPAVFKKNPKLL